MYIIYIYTSCLTFGIFWSQNHPKSIQNPTKMNPVLLSQHTTENSVCFTHRGVRNEFPRSITAPCHGYARGKPYPKGSLEVTAVGFHFLGPNHRLHHSPQGIQSQLMVGSLVDERDHLEPWKVMNMKHCIYASKLK